MVSSLPLFSRFARFQAVSDLRRIAATAPLSHFETMVARIPGMPPAQGLAGLAAAGGRLDSDSLAYHPALVLAATLPGEDMTGFVAATALLLADRLQDGAGQDDLYWHYDAHAQTYRALPPDVRSAILVGFALLHDMGRVTLHAPPAPRDRAARPGGLVRAALTAAPAEAARAFKAALAGDAPAGDALAETEGMWREAGREMAALPALSGAARHLYATRAEWDPYRDWPDARIATQGIAIRFPCALPLPHGPD
jgi:hypothetical protein